MPWVEVISRPQGWVPDSTPRFGRGPIGSLVMLEETAAGIWRARDERSRSALRVNGAAPTPVTRPLEHGDVLQLFPGRTLRFCTREDPPATPSDLERAVADDPRDAMRWNVWADALAERGDERAPLLNELHREDDERRGRRLGPLAALWRDGHLDLVWRRGYLQSATVRTAGLPEATGVLWCLEALWGLPTAAFLEHLRVDALEHAVAVLRSVHGAPRSLGGVAFGPSRVGPAASVLAELEVLRAARPQLRTTAATLVETFRRCTLRGDEGTFEISQPRTRFPGVPNLFLDLEDDGVWITGGEFPLTVNGFPFTRMRLLHGDRIRQELRNDLQRTEAGRSEGRRWDVAYES